MKICYLNHDLKDGAGAGRFGLQLIEHVKEGRPGVESIVLTSAYSSHPLEKPILYPSALKLLFCISRMRAIFRECDIIHALDGFPYGVIAAIVSFGLGKKLIITAVGTGAIQAFRRPIRGAFLRWAYRRADRVVAVSNYTRREILKYVSDLRISVIHHAVDPKEFFAFSDAEFSEEEKARIEKLKPYILTVGSGKPRKGYEYSFSAFAKIREHFPGLAYVAVGYDKGSALADSLGITDKVFCFIGIRRRFLNALYCNAELFMLLPYDDRGDVEGFGFAFLEAAAAGLPVVGTYGSGAEDAVEHEKNGFLVEPRDAAAAADAAIKILSNPALKAQFAKGSIDFARRMNWGNVAKNYCVIYNDILNKP